MSQLIIPIILCGGSGSRLWPASREDYPKQFLSILDNRSLLQNTLLRAIRLSSADTIVIVTTAAMEQQVHEQAAQIDPNLTRHIIVEPCARNTAAAIAFASRYILERFGPTSVLCVMPSDHHIAREDGFPNYVSHALKFVSDQNIITFGIKPTSPHTGYGYIVTGEEISAGIFRVKNFKEKPTIDQAQAMIESGSYWNSGIFLLSLQSSLYHFRRHAPFLYALIQSPSMAASYKALENISIDHAIIEKSADLVVAPTEMEWTDVGTWESFWSLHPKDENRNVLLGKTACLESEGCLVQSYKRLIAISGLKDIVVVETEDAIFVSSRKDVELHRKLADHVARSRSGKADAPWSMTGDIAPIPAPVVEENPDEIQTPPTEEILHAS